MSATAVPGTGHGGMMPPPAAPLAKYPFDVGRAERAGMCLNVVTFNR
jgi:hypothetical protein